MNDQSLSAAAELMQMAARPFEDSVAMPPSVYTSEEFLARERETMFRKDWICAGRAGAMARPGRLSHLERPIYDFAQYLASRTG
jgi:hypothetical protein